MTAHVRAFDDARDRAAVRRCFVELQDVERALDPRIPSGEAIADAYLGLMLERCRAHDGVVLVGEDAGGGVGFVTVLTRFRSDEPDDDPRPHGFVTDLVVAATQRRRGLGRDLLHAAEARARAAGAPWLRLSVKAGNTAAMALYDREGYRTVEVFLEKRLAGPPDG